MMTVKSSSLGYPRLGEKREWKRALESYWNDGSSKEELLATTKELRLASLQKQADAGIDKIPSGDFSLYDHVLDTSVTLGIVPERFKYTDGEVPLETYFAIARGNKDAVASEMTKWFNTNYHYIVPELDNARPQLTFNRPLFYYNEAKNELGLETKPVILGPISYLKLAKGYEEDQFETLLTALIPVYVQIFAELEAAGVKTVQLDEPYLVLLTDKKELNYYKKSIAAFKEAAPSIQLILQTYFERLDHYEAILELPADGFGIDFVADHGDNLRSLLQFGFPEDKILAAGIIDGRNVWRSNLKDKLALLTLIQANVPAERLIIQPSSSLLHVPITVAHETTFEKTLVNGLAFADEKLHEIVLLTKAVRDGVSSIQTELDDSFEKYTALQKADFRNNQTVEAELTSIQGEEVNRALPYAERILLQHEALNLPLLPTTSIGSFPQSAVVRQKRAAWKKGNLTEADYRSFIKEETERWIDIQEGLDLDVLVHGEFERTDMVEYFGQQLSGFQASTFGWVQSYGSRAVRPPLIFGDIAFEKEMTVEETVYAQSLTEKPVKGMLTAPITILNWSFVRDDITVDKVANQIGLALRKEVLALEKAGIGIIQIDEPALREGLPLKEERWKKYLDASVYAFKLTTAGVKNETQIHTHMCYAEFDDIIDTISALDADVISIETSRSHGDIIEAFEVHTYDKEIGLGVYDIHSPRVPTAEEIKQNISRALQVFPPEQFWINPDCGLKTRHESETIDALKTMVDVTKEIRKAYN
ncbi:5-methyltetrahydropteroyltriglutamate--homocysteine S-methyltransferase [Brochothrix thermosphacta]|uniref:5-methyltetrahydropteroyltriglutamate--homocysteine methyltransferase n=1 Tax=Brochothrix thermosphacta TaxID=2756 RepID=A0A1D2LUW5_BROTH|nr:5-methyltetrahydropteroyltriglutamate--homocysteine S-methyltransferase [Brochothrix thermosphacta]ATF27214.1 5-methyltetrahydropteroyltriglutamate--homocysteine S-methyltransferase [Brochothrix thermosphacta]ATH86565.1 5-methyltetrahydropteroyltriglutamate--homocysteine S-methyltransferase [Brochothrix thermosphacta]ODJ66192.1 5-methyltetrahydropteroyltriglutamate--homocysteine S-methyltransferase [Brochothrix thermosphacta]ODJ73726.1 5-methyltetrahydropteroyltriglutamate--homocysteine S-me